MAYLIFPIEDSGAGRTIPNGQPEKGAEREPEGGRIPLIPARLALERLQARNPAGDPTNGKGTLAPAPLNTEGQDLTVLG